jgi:hypothetical protein
MKKYNQQKIKIINDFLLLLVLLVKETIITKKQSKQKNIKNMIFVVNLPRHCRLINS